MKIPIDKENRQEYYRLLEEVFDSNFWTEGKMVKRFEESFSKFTDLESLAFSNAGTALLALFTFAGVKDHEVIIPANTFYATTLASKMAGAKVVYADCNKEDLCISFNDIKRKTTSKTKAICVVHIGGHIAFDIEEIASFCEKEGIYLIEDCAHVHGATYNGKSAGSWGLGGAYSFYATKTMPLGEGGMICSNNPDFIEWAKYFRNYGKKVDDGKVSYQIRNGFNYRMNEVTAALGIVQLKRLPEILIWKRNLAAKFDQIFHNRVIFPTGMMSGYYKYIVFDYDLSQETGKVFARSDLGPVIDGIKFDLPDSLWITEHHHCVPIWYGWEHAEESIAYIADLLIETAKTCGEDP
ncbi:aminotransferase class I/II-fold pyridoxal phosphate-dependent enzyme [Candidatus Parcubacteria bacterium]|nr:MAG: aminotransferase class I/II-fold pyridoxal phosphate-dependent enzyme [Candidatus Parcubacteria bacterium]